MLAHFSFLLHCSHANELELIDFPVEQLVQNLMPQLAAYLSEKSFDGSEGMRRAWQVHAVSVERSKRSSDSQLPPTSSQQLHGRNSRTPAFRPMSAGVHPTHPRPTPPALGAGADGALNRTLRAMGNILSNTRLQARRHEPHGLSSLKEVRRPTQCRGLGPLIAAGGLPESSSPHR